MTEGGTAPILEVNGAKKSFGQQEVLKGVSFKLYPHETLGLLGLSGSGKSVLLRSLIALERLDEGQIIFQGEEIQDLSEEAFLGLRPKISYAFQNGALFDSLTVYENLAFPLHEHTSLSEPEIERKILATLDLVGLKDKTVKVDKLEEMEETDRKKLFELACAQTGIEIDPELFTNSN